VTAGRLADAESGLSLLELMIVMGVLSVVMALSLQALGALMKVTVRDSTQADLISAGRGAVERLVLLLRNDFVQFNTRAGTPLGVNFDLDDGSGPVVRDGILFYVDSNHNAEIFSGAVSGQPQSAGFDDADLDGQPDLIGLGLVPQDINQDGVQDFIDIDNNGQPDDVDRDGQADRLWMLVQVRFNNVAAVSNPALWRAGSILATNVFTVRRAAAGGQTASNIRTFQFSANNPLAQAYDTAAWGGNANGLVEESEIGNIQTADGIINTATEVASIDSISVTLNLARIARQGSGRTSVEISAIDSDRITPRTLMLIKRNGLVGLPDPTAAQNIR
jgi:hypothetical protein